MFKKIVMATALTSVMPLITYSFDNVTFTGLSPYFEQMALRSSVVINGHLATEGSQSRQYTVRLTFSSVRNLERSGANFPRQTCSGVLIAPQVVATAAHCLIATQATLRAGVIKQHEAVRIEFGLSSSDPHYYRTASTDMLMHPDYYYHDINSGRDFMQTTPPSISAALAPGAGHSYSVTQITLNPDRESFLRLKADLDGRDNLYAIYDYQLSEKARSAQNDLALIFLKGPVPSSRPFRPVKIFNDLDNYIQPRVTTNTFYAAGFGLDHFDGRRRSEQSPLRFAKFRTVGVNPSTMIINGSQESVYRFIIGLPLEERFTCYGDSGGPALTHVGSELRLLGVISLGSEGCMELADILPIHNFTFWIEEEMAKRGHFEFSADSRI